MSKHGWIIGYSKPIKILRRFTLQYTYDSKREAIDAQISVYDAAIAQRQEVLKRLIKARKQWQRLTR